MPDIVNPQVAYLVPASIRQEGMVVGVDGALYPPQVEPKGRAEVVALLLRSDLGLTPEQIEGIVPKILTVVNLLGPHLCTCLHVDGGTDPAHGHGYYQCGDCGGLCVSERWCEHEIFNLLWVESMMQQNRHGHVVMKGLKWLAGRMKMAVERIAATVPPQSQKLAMLRAIDEGLGALSHIWHQNSLSYDLYDARHEVDFTRWDETPARLQQKLSAIKAGVQADEFMDRFQFQPLSPEQALARLRERAQHDARKSLEQHHDDIDNEATSWLRARGFRVERETVMADAE